jgi:hypothetical protein
LKAVSRVALGQAGFSTGRERERERERGQQQATQNKTRDDHLAAPSKKSQFEKMEGK